jgi:hypothetical protein
VGVWKAPEARELQVSPASAQASAQFAEAVLFDLDPSDSRPLKRLHTPQQKIKLPYENSSTLTPQESPANAHNNQAYRRTYRTLREERKLPQSMLNG